MSAGNDPRQPNRHGNPLELIGTTMKCEVWRTRNGVTISRVHVGSWPGGAPREECIDLTFVQAKKVREFLDQALEAPGGAA